MAKKKTDTSALEDLKAALKAKNLKRLYIFHGEETFLMEHYLGAVKKLLLDELTQPFNYHRLTEESFQLRALAEAVEKLPMMAEHTLVQVDDIDLTKLGEDGRQKLAEILADIPDYCTVVFTYLTVAWKSDKAINSAIADNGAVVEFAKQEPRDLIPWVGRHFAAKGKRIDNHLCSYLIEITDGTMTALSGEIEKICAYSGADHITKSDIDAVTEPALDSVAFHMTDLMGQGKYAPALLKLQQLLQLQQEPLAILGAIGFHFRRLSAARTLLDNGRSSGDLMTLYKMGSYPAQKTMDAARRVSPGFCRKAMELVLETDHQMKTSADDPERLLELLVLRLAQEAGRG